MRQLKRSNIVLNKSKRKDKKLEIIKRISKSRGGRINKMW